VASAQFARTNAEDGEFRLRDGGWLALSRRPIPGSDSQILLFTDITESKRLRESLQRRQRLSLLGEMAARLAHQIRTPLSAAMLYAGQIGQRSRGEFSAECAGKIQARLRDLEAMVQDMLAFAGGTPSDEEVIDARGLLDAVVETAAADLPDHLRIVTDMRGGNFALLGNRSALAGALLNLVTNAIQHSADAGVITLGAARDADGDIALSVGDCGCGVSEALRQTIFEPFFTTRARGTGLGLAVVRSVAKAHGGDVELDTSAAGSTFTLRLPAINQYDSLPAGASVRSDAGDRAYRYPEPVTEEACHG
jgi:two-component system sensor histidine kinase FlrB